MVEHTETYEILHLWLLTEYIGKGYGKKLLQTVIATFVDASKPIILAADPNAESFYQKQGFRAYSRVESYPKGRFLPMMRKDFNKNNLTDKNQLS